jgi:hypothetical protein
MTEILEVVQNAFITNVVAQGTLPVLKITCTKLKPTFEFLINYYCPSIQPFLLTWTNEVFIPKLEAIPIENRVEPSVKIFKRVLEGVTEVPDEPLLKEMFANLLVSDMNTATKSKVHPKMVSMLADLSVEEAKFLQAFKRTDFLPILELNNGFLSVDAKYIYHQYFYDTGLCYEQIHNAILQHRTNGILITPSNGLATLTPEDDNPYFYWCRENNKDSNYIYEPANLSWFGQNFCQVVLS